MGAPVPTHRATSASSNGTAAGSPQIGPASARPLQLAGVGADRLDTIGVGGAVPAPTADPSSPRVPFAPTGANLPGGLTTSPDLGSGAAGLLLIAVLTGAAALLGPPVGRRLGVRLLLSPRQLATAVPTSPD